MKKKDNKQKCNITFPDSIEKEWDVEKLIMQSEHKITYLLKQQIGNASCILQVIKKGDFSRKNYRCIMRLSPSYFVLPHQIIRQGSNYFILYPKMTTLQECLAGEGLSLKDIFQLGIDLTCAALELIQQHFYFADISPNNIYQKEDGCFCLGDLHILRATAGMTPEYICPEQRSCHNKILPKRSNASSFDLSMQYAIGTLLVTLLKYRSEFDTEEIISLPAKACASQPEHRFSSLREFQKEMENFCHSPAVDLPSSVLYLPEKDHTLFRVKTEKMYLIKKTLFFSLLWSIMLFISCILIILLIFCGQPSPSDDRGTITMSYQEPAKPIELDIQNKGLTSLTETIDEASAYDTVLYLYAGENQLTDIQAVSRLPHLKEIYLNQNQLDQSSLLSISELSELEILVLSHNNLRSLPDFSSLNYLSHLDISGNPDFHEIDSILKLSHLQFLNLSGTNISQKDYQILQNKLLDCEIIYDK